MDRIKIAESLFEQGVNCAQSLLAVYSIELGLNRETALKIASAFGGGIGRMGETCGAVTGAFMIIGLKYGMTDLEDKKAKTKTYELAEQFIKKFKSCNSSNSIMCRELIGFDISSEKELSLHAKEIIKLKCPKFIRDAAEIIEEIL